MGQKVIVMEMYNSMILKAPHKNVWEIYLKKEGRKSMR